MVGIKRSREEALAVEAQSPSSNRTTTCAPQQTSVSDVGEDTKRLTKKSKTTHRSPQDEPQQPPTSSQGPTPSAIVATATAEDQEMRDALSDSDDDVKKGNTRPPPKTTAAEAASYPILIPVLASDMVKNTWAPTNAPARQNYLQEVGQLQLHPWRTPLATPASQVSAQIRHMIYEKLFLGWTNDECIQTYNSYSGGARSGAAVSKAFLPEAWKWFAEENVVVPWRARKTTDQNRLKALGMSAKNFPAPHNTKTSVSGPRTQAAPKVPKEPKAAKAPKQKQTQTAILPAKQEQVRTTNPDTDSQIPEDNDEDTAPVIDVTEYDRVSRQPVLTKFEQTAVDFDDQDHGTPSIHELIRAATNAFGVDDEETDPSVVIVDGKRSYNVHAKALNKHCAFVRDNVTKGFVTDVKVEGRDPVIVQAFINSVSPSPRTTLPEYDIYFAETEMLDESDCLTDPLGVTTSENLKARKIVWNMDACVMMYDLAKVLDCTVVKDLVMDRMMQLIQQEICSNTTQPANKFETLELPLSYLCELDIEKDAALFRMIAGYHLRRTNSEEDHWPKEMADEMISDIFDLLYAPQGGYAPPNTAKGYCQRFQNHRNDMPCWKDAVRGWKLKTGDLISEFFSELRERSANSHDAAIAETEAQEPNNLHALSTLRIQKEMMRWSLQQDEKIAEAMNTYDAHRRYLNLHTTSTEDKQTTQEKVNQWEAHIQYLKDDQDDGWGYFSERWCEGDDRREFEKENSLNVRRGLTGRELPSIQLLQDGRKEDGSWTYQYFFAHVQPSLEDGHDWW